jgi:hypothetical protein
MRQTPRLTMSHTAQWAFSEISAIMVKITWDFSAKK